jgi:hypothetical protein
MGPPEQAEGSDRATSGEGSSPEGAPRDPVVASDLESSEEAERSTAEASERLDELEERARRAAEEIRRQNEPE